MVLGEVGVDHGADFLHLFAHCTAGLVAVEPQVFDLLLDALQVEVVVADDVPETIFDDVVDADLADRGRARAEDLIELSQNDVLPTAHDRAIVGIGNT